MLHWDTAGSFNVLKTPARNVVKLSYIVHSTDANAKRIPYPKEMKMGNRIACSYFAGMLFVVQCVIFSPVVDGIGGCQLSLLALTVGDTALILLQFVITAFGIRTNPCTLADSSLLGMNTQTTKHYNVMLKLRYTTCVFR